MSKQIVEINKDVMVDGEELQDTISKVFRAVRSAGTTKERILGIFGIYSDHVVVRDAEDGTYFRMQMKRTDKGEVELSEPEPGRMLFVPDSAKAAEDDQGEAAPKFKCPKCGHLQEAKGDGEVKCAKCGTPMEQQEKVAKSAYRLVTLPSLTVAVDKDGFTLGSKEMLEEVARKLADSKEVLAKVEIEVDRGFWGGKIL